MANESKFVRNEDGSVSFEINDKKILQSNQIKLGSGESIKIPLVTNLSYNSANYTITWDAPDLTELAEYNPSVKYKVIVDNQDVIETTDTNAEIYNYLSQGSHMVGVAVILTITDTNSTKTNVILNDPIWVVITLTEQLPRAEQNLRAVRIGNYIYLLAGQYGNIYKFDITNETLTKLNQSLSCNTAGIAAIGTDIYIFGGYKLSSIKKFDTINETITTLVATLPNNLWRASCVNYGSDIYLFGGKSADSTSVNTIYKFDTINESIITLSVTLPYATDSMACEIVGDDVYLFGGYGRTDIIVKFNITNETITTLTQKLPNPTDGIASGLIGTDIYLFGGFAQNVYWLDKIYKFDTTNETLTLMQATLPDKRTEMASATADNIVYLFGGNEYNVSTKIYKFLQR